MVTLHVSNIRTHTRTKVENPNLWVRTPSESRCQTVNPVPFTLTSFQRAQTIKGGRIIE